MFPKSRGPSKLPRCPHCSQRTLNAAVVRTGLHRRQNCGTIPRRPAGLSSREGERRHVRVGRITSRGGAIASVAPHPGCFRRLGALAASLDTGHIKQSSRAHQTSRGLHDALASSENSTCHKRVHKISLPFFPFMNERFEKIASRYSCRALRSAASLF